MEWLNFQNNSATIGGACPGRTEKHLCSQITIEFMGGASRRGDALLAWGGSPSRCLAKPRRKVLFRLFRGRRFFMAKNGGFEVGAKNFDLHVRVGTQDLERIDELTRDLGLDRSELVRQLIARAKVSTKPRLEVVEVN